MCGKHRFDPNPADGPAEGQTVRLTDLPQQPAHRYRHGFPWWVLWTIWPLIFLMKSAAYLLTPLVSLMAQPITLTVTPLPLLLIGVGMIILLVGAIRRVRNERGA